MHIMLHITSGIATSMSIFEALGITCRRSEQQAMIMKEHMRNDGVYVNRDTAGKGKYLSSGWQPMVATSQTVG